MIFQTIVVNAFNILINVVIFISIEIWHQLINHFSCQKTLHLPKMTDKKDVKEYISEQI